MPKTFYIIDGHAQIYRAFFAPFRDLTSPTGEPTKATFVFTQMLINLVAQRKPDYLCMVIDSDEEKVFRKTLYPEYKANRPPRPDGFDVQEKRILQIVRDAGVPIFESPGFEADDVIATMARQLQEKDFEVFLVSKDKDLRQILSPCTHMYDVQADKVIDEKALLEERGYTPQQSIEVQTLMGDATDNVPGIPGVGEKTAVKLIQKYGTADAVLNHLDELTPKMRENFVAHRDKLKVSRELVTLKTDVPMRFDVEHCSFKGLSVDGLKPHLSDLGFWTLAKKIGVETTATSSPASAAPKPKPSFEGGLFGDLGAKPRPEARGTSPDQASPPQEVLTSATCEYELIDTEESFEKFLNQLKKQKRFAFDTETDALGAVSSNLVGMSFSFSDACGYYIPVMGPTDAKILPRDLVIGKLKPILEDPKIEKVGHNIKYDMLSMRQVGVEVKGVALDSMIAAFLVDPGRNQYGIDPLSMHYLNFRKIATVELIGKGKHQLSMAKVDLNQISRYASEDADIAFRLSQLLDRKLTEIPALRKLNDDIETPLIDVLVEMENNGIAVDPSMLKEQSEVLGKRVEELRGQIYHHAGGEFNIDSTKQLAELLFEKLKLRVIKKVKTGPSTDVEVLEKLALDHPVPRLILEYRQLVKLKNTYLDNLTEYLNPKTHRIHASFNQIGAATGRLSCSDPNLQNIPIRTDEGRRIRLAFVPGDREKNILLTADYSQIELRVLAHFTQEPALVKAFENDEDIHKAVAAEVFHVPLDQVTREQRGQAKTINFGIVYGVTAMGLARRIEGLTVKAAQELINAYNKRFPAIEQFLNQCVMNAQSQGYVETLLGRRRPLPDIHSGVLQIRNAAERMAINSVVQGTAADLIKLAMVNIHRRIRKEGLKSRMLLQVHDELVFETPVDVVEEEAKIIQGEMVNAMKLTVPLKVEVGWGKNWQEGK
jgi:DNA polymerase-1